MQRIEKFHLFQKERKNGKSVIMLRFFITPLSFEDCWYPRTQEIMGIMRAFLRIRFWSMSNHTIRQIKPGCIFLMRRFQPDFHYAFKKHTLKKFKD